MSAEARSPHPQVGAPDPERATSPILGEDEDIEFEAGAPGLCHFNGTDYAFGTYVSSGSEILLCEAPGVWVRKGELAAGTKVLD